MKLKYNKVIRRRVLYDCKIEALIWGKLFIRKSELISLDIGLEEPIFEKRVTKEKGIAYEFYVVNHLASYLGSI